MTTVIVGVIGSFVFCAIMCAALKLLNEWQDIVERPGKKGFLR